jgi:hypothetical protein
MFRQDSNLTSSRIEGEADVYGVYSDWQGQISEQPYLAIWEWASSEPESSPDGVTSEMRLYLLTEKQPGSFAEFERSMVRERTRAGLAAARDRGVKVGRPAKLSRHQQEEVIRTVRDGSKTAADAARLFGLHRSNGAAEHFTIICDFEGWHILLPAIA